MSAAGDLTALERHRALSEIWATPPGFWGRLSAVNHTVVGRRFIVTAFVFFGIGGVLAMLIRAQIAGPHTAFLDAGAYGQVLDRKSVV